MKFNIPGEFSVDQFLNNCLTNGVRLFASERGQAVDGFIVSQGATLEVVGEFDAIKETVVRDMALTQNAVEI
jgi:hypothetical protein